MIKILLEKHQLNLEVQIVGSIDYKNIANNDPMVFTNNGRNVDG